VLKLHCVRVHAAVVELATNTGMQLDWIELRKLLCICH